MDSQTTTTDFNWHVVYTRPKAERIVAEGISSLGIESYLPLCKVVRQWSDRRKKMEVPLFPNYVFVKVDRTRRESLYSIKGIVKFISSEGKPVIVREREILTIKKVLVSDEPVENDHYFQPGMKAKIMSGYFAGLEGILVRKNGGTRFIVKVDKLMKAYSFNLPASALAIVSN